MGVTIIIVVIIIIVITGRVFSLSETLSLLYFFSSSGSEDKLF